MNTAPARGPKRGQKRKENEMKFEEAITNKELRKALKALKPYKGECDVIVSKW